MSEETTKELLLHNQANFQKVFAMLDTLISGLGQLEARVAAREVKDAITRPLWQEIRADQQRMLEHLDKVEAHLQRQDEKTAQLENKMDHLEIKVEDGFFKINDKIEMLTEKWIETQLELRYIKRRVDRLETVK